MLSKRKAKDLSALQHKKNRLENKLFLVEGEKIVEELLISGWKIDTIVATEGWIAIHRYAGSKCSELIEASEAELKKVSSLKTPNQVVAVVKIPDTRFNLAELKDRFILALDEVKDPGNLGTIIRISDWFGIKNIICSESTVDAFNPKVVQASMGSIFRVSLHYTGLMHWLKEYKQVLKQPVYGAYLEGENIYHADLSTGGVLVLGNESRGISEEISPFINEKIYIPRFQDSGAESLNVSVAAAIFCSEFRRRH